MSFLGGSAGKESACSVGDLGLFPGFGRSPGEGNSCIFNIVVIAKYFPTFILPLAVFESSDCSTSLPILHAF